MSSNKRISSDYDFTPQMKRLSFDDGKDFRQSVYDKTLKLLFNGAKCNLDSPTRTRFSTAAKNLANTDRKQLKQVLLDNNGKLDSKRSIFNSQECYPSSTEKCAFCERLNCFTVLHQCQNCNEYFCGNCSLSTYTENEEAPLCLSCFK